MAHSPDMPQIVDNVTFEEDEIRVEQWLEAHPNAAIKNDTSSIPIKPEEDKASHAKSLLERHRKLNFQEAYNLSSNNQSKGRCLIINNRDFQNGSKLSMRRGTDKDRDSLKGLFENLGLCVKFKDGCENLTAAEMFGKCSTFILDPEFEHRQCCVICILSHGYQDNIYGTDGKAVKEKDILGLFEDPDCKLNGKPKLVIIQACRVAMKKGPLGKLEKLLCLGRNSPDTRVDEAAKDALSDISESMRLSNINDVKFTVKPSTVDILIAHSTLPGAFSWRNHEQGSWYIQALCKVFNSRAATEHVADMLVMVSYVVHTAFNGAQIPNPINQLHKKLYFFPKPRTV